MISGVIFDLDGTLYHLSLIRARLTFSLLRSLSFLRHLNASRAALRNQTYRDEQELTCAFIRELAARVGTTEGAAADWYEQRFLVRFLDLLERRAFARPGLLPLLSRLRAAGIKLAVVSDIGLVAERLRAIGVPPESFDLLLCTEQMGELKPSPRSLLAVAEKWGCPAEQITMVGDRIDRDAAAAAAAGMSSIIVDNHPPLFGHRRKRGITLVPWREAAETIIRQAGLE
jgi:HAD superfamily hydrolase (TIGR01549 family)